MLFDLKAYREKRIINARDGILSTFLPAAKTCTKSPRRAKAHLQLYNNYKENNARDGIRTHG